MKYPNETEEDFLRRVKEAKSKGICIFRDDANMDKILDLIDDYCDLVDAITIERSNNNAE